jgi:ankyrin repeat protein
MDPHAELVQLLLDGARYGDEEDIDSALRQHVGIDSTDEAGRTALHMACANGHESIVSSLINAGAVGAAIRSCCPCLLTPIIPTGC